MRVLVVDDYLDSAETIARLLRFYGHEVEACGDGPTCLSRAAEFQPDAVVLDIAMPAMDGWEVARHLRSDYGPDLVIIAATALDSAEDIQRSFDAGFDQHLVKPVPLPALLAALD